MRQLCLLLLPSASFCSCNVFPVHKIIIAQLTLWGNLFSVLCLCCFWWRPSLLSTCHCWQGHIKDQRTSYEGVVGKSNLCFVSLIKRYNFKNDFIFCSSRLESIRLIIFYKTGWLSILKLMRRTMLWFVTFY